MCETFKWIQLLVVELQKDGLQNPVKISLCKWLCDARAFQSTLKMQISDNRRRIQFKEEHVYFRMRHSKWETRSHWNQGQWEIDKELVISKYSYLICRKMLAQKAVFTCCGRYSSHITQKFAFVYTTFDVHRQMSTYSMNLWPSFDTYNHHCKSKTAKSFEDYSSLLCTTPKYYVWPLFYLLLLQSLLAAVPCLFLTQCCHSILRGRCRIISMAP